MMKTKLPKLLVLLAASCTAHATTVYQQAVLAKNPLLYWTFDEAGDTDDARSMVNDTADNTLSTRFGSATRTASTTTTGGVSLGRAASFDGTANSNFHASDLFGASMGFIPTQLWAVEFWFKVDDSAQYFAESGTADPSLIYNFGNPNTLEMLSPSGRTGLSGATATPNEWHHVVMAFYGNSLGFNDNLREFYIDGVLTQSTTDTYSSGFSLQEFTIGSAVDGTWATTGQIDEFALYELGGLADLDARKAHVAGIASHYSLVPEPSSTALLGLGALALILRRRKG